MDSQAINSVFRPKASKAEKQADKSTIIVRQLAAEEAEHREKKTARLRLARLEREAEAPAPVPPVKKRAKRS